VHNLQGVFGSYATKVRANKMAKSFDQIEQRERGFIHSIDPIPIISLHVF
jgi:hypothetical protein